MNSKDGSSAGTPRFDSVMAAAEGRRDDWQRLQSLTQAMIAKGYDAVSAQKAAYGLITGSLQVQSATMSFNDAFMLIGITVVLVSPAVFILRSSKKRSAGVEMAH